MVNFGLFFFDADIVTAGNHLCAPGSEFRHQYDLYQYSVLPIQYDLA